MRIGKRVAGRDVWKLKEPGVNEKAFIPKNRAGLYGFLGAER